MVPAQSAQRELNVSAIRVSIVRRHLVSSLWSRYQTFAAGHPWRWSICFIAFMVALGLVLGNGMKALGAEPTHIAETSKACTHTNVDGECWFGARISARKFRHHYFHRASGLPVKKIFARPRAARAIIVDKIAHKIDHHSVTHLQRNVEHFGLSPTSALAACTPQMCSAAPTTAPPGRCTREPYSNPVGGTQGSDGRTPTPGPGHDWEPLGPMG